MPPCPAHPVLASPAACSCCSRSRSRPCSPRERPRSRSRAASARTTRCSCSTSPSRSSPFPEVVDVRAFGYGGGTTTSGVMVPRGGFDNILSLFDALGGFLFDNDDGLDAAVDPTTGLAADARLIFALPPGSYIVALTQFDNFALRPTLADGFLEQGNPNFTADPFFFVGRPLSRAGCSVTSRAPPGGAATATGPWTSAASQRDGVAARSCRRAGQPRPARH